MLTSVPGSLRIELCVAFSRAGANTCPSRASLDANAIAVGRTRPTASASCASPPTPSRSWNTTPTSRPSSKVRSCSSRGSIGRTPAGPVPNWGSTFRASSTRSPASARRSIPGSPENGRTSHSSVSAADALTAVGRLGGAPTPRWLDGALADALWSDLLVQAPGDLDKQPGEQVPIGFDTAQLSEHLLDRMLEVLVLALDFLAQRLHLLRQAVGLVALELAQLFRRRAKAFFNGVIMLALGPLGLLVGIGAQVFFFAELGCERLHLLLRARFEGTEIARRLSLDVLEALEKPLLEHRETAIVILHLIAEQQIADLVHAHHFAARKCAVSHLPGRSGFDGLNL